MARVAIKKAEETKVPALIEVPDIETQVVPFYLRGISGSTLLVNNFNPKMRMHLEDISTGKTSKPKRGALPPRDPDAEFQAARILDDQGRDCVPARYIKAALITAAKMDDVPVDSQVVRRTLYVRGDLIPIEDPRTRKPARPSMRTDWVRRGRWGAKVPMQCYRAAFEEWALKIDIEFEPKLIPHAQLIYLVRRAGLAVGLCEWRPEKNGEMGRFDIITAAPVGRQRR